MKRIILLVLCVLLLAVPSYGAKYDVGGDDYSTLEDAFDAAQEGYITDDGEPDPDPVFNFIEDYTLDSVIEVTDAKKIEYNNTTYYDDDDGSKLNSLTFTGAKVITSAASERHLTNSSSLTVTFSSITLKGGSSGGGVEINSGTVTFSGATFTNNESTNGGALYVNGGTVTINGSTFTSNTASGSGGALYVSGGAVTFSGSSSSFKSNTAENGGALYIGSTVNFEVAPTFGGSSLSEANEATNGGAIYIASNTSFTAAPTFSYNTATNGGALYIAQNITVGIPTGQTFSNNSADQGGAIWSAGIVSFSGTSTFTSNKAANGGAIYSNAGTMTFSTVPTFSTNTAANGGAFYVYGGTINFAASSGAVTFDGASANSATYGGLFYVYGGNVNFNSEVNFTHYVTSDSGGVFYVTGGTVAFTGNVTFTLNSATTGGGGAIFNAGGTISIGGTAVFTSNSAYNGGAVALSGDAVMPTFSSTVSFDKNSAANNGGAIWSNNASITVTNIYSFTSNTATQNGGALYTDSGTITISGVTIDTANKATSGGGGLAASNTGTINVDDSIIKNQTAPIGGALCGSQITITSADFIGNKSTVTTGDTGGGAICISQDAGQLIIRGEGARFIENTSTRDGGAIAVINSRIGATVTATNVYFEANTASHNGGAMYLGGDAAKNLAKITCTNNTAGNVGGAVWSSGQITINTSYFIENRSTESGGAIYYDQTGGNNLFNFAQSMAVDNFSNSGSGGAIYVHANNVNITQSTFTGNNAAGGTGTEGGAVFMDATAGVVENCTFTASKAYNGGGLAIYGRNNIRSCAFIDNNIASNYGGGLYIGGSASVTIIATLIVGNGASIGGDVYNNGSIISNGYNRIGIFGTGGSSTSWVNSAGDSAKTDRESPTSSTWTTSTFYGSNTLSENAYDDTKPPYIGYNEEYRVLTVMLAEVDIDENNRAINIIPYDERQKIPQYDERGVDRYALGAALDIGPVFFGETIPNPDDPSKPYTISSVKMSGIPNTLKSPGQTANLAAIILYTNGLSAYGGSRSGEEPVTWSSSNRNVVRVTSNGVVTAWRTPGTAYITVSTVRAGGNGSPATDTQAIIVDFQATSMNLSDAFIDNLLNFNQGDLYEHDMSVGIANVNASTLSSSSFISAFYSNWSYEPVLIDELDSSALFSSQSSYNMTVSTSANETFNKPGVKFSYSGIDAGELLPITYSWAFDGTQSQTIFGYNFADKNIDSTLVNDIFKVLQIDFAGDSQAWHVCPSSNVTASEAYSAGALALTKTDNGNGIRIDLTVYLANVSGNAGLVNNLLVLPDGVADSQLNGTMWITRNTSGSGESGGGTDTDPLIPVSGGGGGGGGCNSLGLGLVAAALMFALRRK